MRTHVIAELKLVEGLWINMTLSLQVGGLVRHMMVCPPSELKFD